MRNSIIISLCAVLLGGCASSDHQAEYTAPGNTISSILSQPEQYDVIHLDAEGKRYRQRTSYSFSKENLTIQESVEMNTYYTGSLRFKDKALSTCFLIESELTDYQEGEHFDQPFLNVKLTSDNCEPE